MDEPNVGLPKVKISGKGSMIPPPEPKPTPQEPSCEQKTSSPSDQGGDAAAR